MSDQDRELLDQRARLLARPRHAGSHAQAAKSFALFERGGVRYAIDPRFVFEVARVLAPTPLPLCAPHWLGISSLHGELLALVDLALLVGQERSAPPLVRDAVERDAPLAELRSFLVLVMGTERREFGLQIDAVLETKAITEELARTPPGDSAGQLLLGTTREGVRVLCGEALLSDPRLTTETNLSSEA